MAFCTNCGTKLTDGAKFCASCGTSVEGAASEPKSAAKKESVSDKPPINNTAGVKEKLNAGREKINAGINKLPFKKMAEKIPAGARAKVPLLDKAIPFANQIACGLAAALVVTVIAVSGGSKSNDNDSRSAPTFSQNSNDDFEEGLELAGDLDSRIRLLQEEDEEDEELQRMLNSPQFIRRSWDSQTDNSNLQTSQEENTEGTFVLTDIMNLNGKYAYFTAQNSDENLIGCQSVNMSTKTITLVQISRGRVNLPTWILNSSNNSPSRYYGNGTFTQNFCVYILNTSTLKFESSVSELFFPPTGVRPGWGLPAGDPTLMSNTVEELRKRGVLEYLEYLIPFSSVTFSNGNVTKDVDEGIPLNTGYLRD